MPTNRQAVPLRVAALTLALGAVACAQEATVPMATGAGCLAAGTGRLQAQLRGALVADLDWRDAQMECEGGLRPDGGGVRISIAGPLESAPGSDPRRLRFIFGIDLADSAAGEALALPTNLTLIIEGEQQQLYATRGDDKCAVEQLRRSPVLAGDERLDRVDARGYCTGPASDLAGSARVLVPTFSFTAQMRSDGEP